MVRPYWGITHDAKLYAVQVMNRVTEGFFDQDLFFLYGSQDSYSVFSILLAPLAATLGLTGSFFLVYVASISLLIFAEIRLVRCLVPDRLAGNAALVLLAVSDLPWGGWGVFHVHESFLTARLPATALTVLGLEQLLRRHFVRALLLMLLAMGLHPLMAVGGLLVAVASICIARLPLKAVLWIGLTTALAVAMVLVWQPLGTCLLGYVDPRWYDIVRRRNPYSFPAAWSATDWSRIAYSLGIVVVASKYLKRDYLTVIRLVVLLALAGVGGSVIAEVCPYRLPLQGQPYRGLWLLQFLAVPLGVFVMFRLWEKGTVAARLGTIFVLCCTGRLFLWSSVALESVPSALTMSAGLFILFAIIFYRMRYRGQPSAAVHADWLCPGLLASLMATAAWLSLTNAVGFCWSGSGRANPSSVLWMAPRVCGDAVVAFGGILLIMGLWSVTQDVRRAGLAAAVLWVGLSTAAFFFQSDFKYWDPFLKNRTDISFVRQFVREHWQEGDGVPLVYWPTNPIHVWFDIPAHSFYSWNQTAGVVFNRRTAIEGQRRALLVRKFEIADLREIYSSNSFWNFYSPFYQSAVDEPGPTRQDLIALCKEEKLDFVVLRRAFTDLLAATNGTIFVYDCRLIRTRQLAGRTRHAAAMEL